MSHSALMKLPLLLSSLSLALVLVPAVSAADDAAAPAPAAEDSAPAPTGESMADGALRHLIERQQELMAQAAKDRDQDHFDEDAFRTQMESVCNGYETLLRANPKFAKGYAAYGYLLGKLDQRKQSIAILLKANQLDPNQPLVKNQIGNYLAEEGRPLEAVEYYLSAIKLAPKEPLYHYQLGTLLYEARDDFLKSGEWTADAIDHSIHQAFKQAAELAPDRIEFTYRYAESFYTMATPDWEGALKEWTILEKNAPSAIERQTMRLHMANVLIKLNRRDEARHLLDTVLQPELLKQKEKLLAELDGKATVTPASTAAPTVELPAAATAPSTANGK